MKRPPLSTGDVVENYELLFAYWRKARELGREDLIERTLIKEEDLKLLEEMIRESGAGGAPLNLGLLIDRLTETLSSRVDPDVAKKALKDLGITSPEEDARTIIARILAGWLIEVGQIRKILSLKKSWDA